MKWDKKSFADGGTAEGWKEKGRPALYSIEKKKGKGRKPRRSLGRLSPGEEEEKRKKKEERRSRKRFTASMSQNEGKKGGVVT